MCFVVASLAFACATYEASAPEGDAKPGGGAGCATRCGAAAGTGGGLSVAGGSNMTGAAGGVAGFGGVPGAGTLGGRAGAPTGTGGTGRAVGPGESAGAGGEPGLAIGGAPDGATQTWSFETDSEGWALRDQSKELAASLTQKSGALELLGVPFSTTKQFVDVAYSFPAAADLRGRTLRATLQRISGGFVGVQLYVYAGAWVSPGFESLSSGDVTVLTLAVDALAAAGFTPERASRIGLKLGTGSNASNALALSSIEIMEVTLD